MINLTKVSKGHRSKGQRIKYSCRLQFIYRSIQRILNPRTWAPLVAIGYLGFCNSIQSTKASGLASYRAIYGMSLGNSPGPNAPSGIRGVMSYEFRNGCESWTVDSKVYLHLYFGRRRKVESARKMITWESKDGLMYRFWLEESNDGKTIKQMQGAATLKVKGDTGLVEYTKPRTMKLELPKGTVFPTTHLVELIASSMSGEQFLGKYLFDGASLDEPNMVNAVIKKRSLKNKFAAPVTKTLRDAKSWEARLAYFPIKSIKETPEFELDVRFRQDGIVEELVQDYNSYTVVTRLRRIELLTSENC